MPGNPLYNAAEYVRIDGPLDVPRFEEALRRTVAEADVLHVRFEQGPRSVSQVLYAASDDWPLPVIGTSGDPDPYQAARAWMDTDLETVVGLEKGPLFAHALFVLGGDLFLWYHRAHHIALDGYSFSLIAGRVAQLYTEEVTGRPCPIPPFGPLKAAVEADLAYQSSEQRELDRTFWHARFADRPARPA